MPQYWYINSSSHTIMLFIWVNQDELTIYALTTNSRGEARNNTIAMTISLIDLSAFVVRGKQAPN